MEILVSQEDQWILTKYKWHIGKQGYVHGRINRKTLLMHRYIMIEILKNNLTRHNIVDHINNIRCDNRRENLRIVDHAQNSRNRKKMTNVSSNYIGVSKFESKFKVSLTFDGITQNAYYEDELCAAWQYDLWVTQFQISCKKINNIKKPLNFVEYEKKQKRLNLPKNITKESNKFLIKISGKRYGLFETLELAEEQLNKIRARLENERINQILNDPIKRNLNGVAIIIWRDKEILIDDDMYYKLIINSISFTKQYACIKINNRFIAMHRYIMNYYEPDCLDYVDHINGNVLDNRKSNLRIVTPKQNAMNKASRKGSSSQYIGVSFHIRYNKWQALITIDEETTSLGYFDNEIEAAKKRDEAILKYNRIGRLNFPQK